MTLTQTPTAPTADLIRQAAALCAAGRFGDALSIVTPWLDDATLAVNLRVDALNVAGSCHCAMGDALQAEKYWRECLRLRPDHADVHACLGALFRSLGRLSAAKAMYRQLVSLRPVDADAHFQFANVLYGLGYKDDARASYRAALALRPAHAHAHYNHGIVLAELGRAQEAEAAYRHALNGLRDHAELHNNLGSVLVELGRLDEADAAYREALTLRPQFPEALNNLAGVLKSAQRLAEAELACRLALALRPDFADAHLNLGAVLIDLQRVPEAEAAYREAIRCRPDYAQAHYNLGIALFQQERYDEAGDAYRDAIRCAPDLVHAHNNLGCVLRSRERFPEAIDAFERAIELDPTLAEAQANLGNAFAQMGRVEEAERAYRRAIALRADYGEASFGLAVLLLSLGRFEEGWPLYESRYVQPTFVHHQTRALLRCPQWTGEPLAGKSLLIWQEDGLGDMLQFGRYCALLKAQGAARITFAGAASLHRLMLCVDGVDAVLDHADALAQIARFDCWTSLLSAPLYARTTIDTIPRPARITLDGALVERWKPAMDALPPGPKIGLVWKGNPNHHNDTYRSMPALRTLAPLWNVPGVSFVSLQKGAGEDEARDPPAGQALLDLGAQIADFADTAAIVAQLDLVICVDTSTAHLAATLGKPCWVMLPARDIDWRWMHRRLDSPWYPHTLRLFRRTVGEDWPVSVERVADALAERFGGSA